MDKLTPAQFEAARALARAFNHLWGTVPDGTYHLDDIKKYSRSLDHFGIGEPTLEESEEGPKVVHITGSGRLSWEISSNGDVTLSIYRPRNLLPFQSSSLPIPPTGDEICVAQVKIINRDSTHFQVKTYMYASSSYTECYDKYRRPRENTHAYYYEELRDNVLFERHVTALIEPIVALLAPHVDQYSFKDQSEYLTAIRPSIDKAHEWLKPLFDRALPDPYIREYDFETQEWIAPPILYWTRAKDEWQTGAIFSIHYRGESFPLETEKSAVHAYLLLRRYPEMPLIEAVKRAISSRSHRPSDPL